MRATVNTKLSIYEWGRIMGMHPLHLGQVFFTSPDQQYPVTCQASVMQYEWQTSDAISRESIARAILQAETAIEEQLGFRLAPSYELDEWQPTQRPYRKEYVNYNGHDIRGFGGAVQARWGHYISGGIRSKTLLGSGSLAITWSDADGDTYKETGTVTVAVDVAQNPCELKVYYPGRAGEDDWEIRPSSAVVSNATATITFRRECCALERLQEGLFPRAIDGAVDANFLTEVDAYRVYLDPQTQVSMLWEPPGGGGWCGVCSGTGCPVCGYAIQSGCTHLRDDPRLSLVVCTPADWDEDALDFTPAPYAMPRSPDIVRLYYLAGLRDKSQSCTEEMDYSWKLTVAHMASALLDRSPCDCITTQWEIWRQDLALTRGGDRDSDGQTAYTSISPKNLANPFGTRKGQVDAWNRVVNQASGAGRLAYP